LKSGLQERGKNGCREKKVRKREKERERKIEGERERERDDWIWSPVGKGWST
jgi:hypothetical protein